MAERRTNGEPRKHADDVRLVMNLDQLLPPADSQINSQQWCSARTDTGVGRFLAALVNNRIEIGTCEV